MYQIGTTLTQHIINEQQHHNTVSDELIGLLHDIAIACKKIASLTNKGALVGVLGAAMMSLLKHWKQPDMSQHWLQKKWKPFITCLLTGSAVAIWLPSIRWMAPLISMSM